MANGFVVHASLLLFNFVTSIIHSTAGFGDAIVLHVLWLTATEVAPDIFNETALGDSPVKAVTLIMYCRVVIMTPALAYLSFRDGIFLPQMTTVMAVPSTLNALAGIFIFKKTSGDALKVVLGSSSLMFAILYAVILASKKTLCRKMVQRLRNIIWKCTRSIHLKYVDTIPVSTAKTYVSTNTGKLARGEKSAVSDSADVDGTSSITFVSTTAGSLITHREAMSQLFTESAPVSDQLALTSPVARPTNTRLVTCSHSNRNMSDDDRNKIAMKLGASCAAAVSGMMGSLTGVADPAHIIFISLFDVPAYMMRVNLIMQSLPGAALRFTFACSTAMFKIEMAPLLFTSVVGGYAGLVTGVMLGRALGPESRNVFVLALLLLASLVVLTHSAVMLVALVLGCAVVTAVAVLNERQEAAIEVEVRHAIEGGLEARRTKSSVSPHNTTTPLVPESAPVTNHSPSPVRSRSGTSGNRGRHCTLDRSQQCSTWVRRADLMRPPPLWDDDGNPSQRLFPAARKNFVSTPPTPAPWVSSATELRKTAVEKQNTTSDPVVTALPPLCQQDMCTEEARQSVESPCEELLCVPSCDLK